MTPKGRIDLEEVYEKYEMRLSAGGDVIEFSHLCLEREKSASLGGQDEEVDSVVALQRLCFRAETVWRAPWQLSGAVAP